MPFRSVVLDGETVLFNPASWETHVLNPAAAAALEYVAEGPKARSDVAQFFSEVLAPDLAADAAEHADRVLDELCRLSLVELDDGEPDPQH